MRVFRRFEEHHIPKPGRVTPLPSSHPAIKNARTLFPSTVVEASDAPRLLVSGKNQRKIGDKVVKGAWKGLPIYCLTLEERATCPRTCQHWGVCYGNGMPQARRHKHGPELEYLLHQELAAKTVQHRFGFVVRLHILGDFYDAAYIALWGRWLAEFPLLHIFGYTAHLPDSDEGLTLRRLNTRFEGRCAIRFSGRGLLSGTMRAATIWEVPTEPVVAEGIVCPAQTGGTDCCGTCGLCWSTTKNIAFIAHGQHFKNREAA
jgi:hypothetical protein